MNNKIRWGIIAPGKIARKFADDLIELSDCQITAVASRSIERAKEFSEIYQIPHVFKSYDDLFASDVVDVVYIASPHSFHKNLAIAAMKSGKHVLCEKPLGVNSAEVKAMIETARAEKVFLMEALWSRFNPTIQKIKALVDEHAIGALKYINADFAFYALDRPKESRLFNLELAGGSLLDIGIYPVFLAYLLLGKPDEISAKSHFNETGTEIQTSIIFNYKDAQAMLYSSLAHDSRMSAEIAGTKGSITINPRFHETDGYTLKTGIKTSDIKAPKIGKGYTHEIIEVNNCLRENKLESSFWSHQNSIDLIGLLDAIREKSGISFPFEY